MDILKEGILKKMTNPKNKLWAFGDSYTAGILPDIGHFTPYVEYLKYLGISKEEFPLAWPYELADKLNLEPEVIAVGGASNSEIFNNIAKNSHRFESGDIIIINWTYLNRFMVGMTEDDYQETIPFRKFRRASISTTSNEIDNGSFKYGNNEFYERLGWNRSLLCWVDEILHYENIIDTLCKSLGVEVFYWSSQHHVHTMNLDKLNQRKYICNDIINEGLQFFINHGHKINEIAFELIFLSMYPYGSTSIQDETNSLVNDLYHRGIRGNSKQAELFYCYIKGISYPEKINEFKDSL